MDEPLPPSDRWPGGAVQQNPQRDAPEDGHGGGEGLGQVDPIRALRVSGGASQVHRISPFKLLYGREVQGPLDVLKETAEEKCEEGSR